MLTGPGSATSTSTSATPVMPVMSVTVAVAGAGGGGVAAAVAGGSNPLAWADCQSARGADRRPRREPALALACSRRSMPRSRSKK